MSEPIYVTEAGLAKMKEELAQRSGPKRQEIAERLQAAIKMGDLKENADYHAAKEDQAFNEGRVQELEHAIRNAEIIVERAADGRVRLGSTVTIVEVDDDWAEEETYRIVGAKEADPTNGYISHVSPIGRALIGRRTGDSVHTETPGGSIQFRIVRIT